MIAIAGVFAGRVDAAGNFMRDVRERGFERHAGIAVENLLLAAERFLVIHGCHGAAERRFVGIKHEFAVAHVIEIECFSLYHLVHQLAAVKRQTQEARGRQLALRGVAGEHELQAEAPLKIIQARRETQGRIALHEPRRHLGQHTGAGERRHVAIGKLAAVGVAGFETDARVAFNNGHLVAGAREEIGRGHAGDAGAEHADFHALINRSLRLTSPRLPLDWRARQLAGSFCARCCSSIPQAMWSAWFFRRRAWCCGRARGIPCPGIFAW